MDTRTIAASVAIGLLLVAGSGWAHHNFSAVFDLTKRFTLTGTLTKVDWRNPHIELSLEAKDDHDKAETWTIEGQPPNFYATRKVGKEDFVKSIGQAFTVEGLRAKDGTLYGLMRKVTFPDGTVVNEQQ
jgi:hypothetical protein